MEEKYIDLGFAKLDIERKSRTGVSEVIYGEGKEVEHIKKIIAKYNEKKINTLVTRVNEEKGIELKKDFPEGIYDKTSKLFTIKNEEENLCEKGYILVACAGTSDLAVAEEAAQTAEFLGNKVERLYDAGVAGIHRLIKNIDILQNARVVIAVAGMEGALPSVIGGLVKAPVIAVPTSVGYGANFGGLAALLGMLNSCSSGVSVVNIDNGFGAGFLASKINKL